MGRLDLDAASPCEGITSAPTPWATPKSRLTEAKDHRTLADGYRYWIMRLNSRGTVARGVADGDLIMVFNDWTEVILAAQVTERVPPGTVHSYESCADYLPTGSQGYSPDTDGCVNILAPKRFITPTSTAMANNSCLLQVEKWEGNVT
jgi:anaerobic selenocysteine-containing dehydrogenase